VVPRRRRRAIEIPRQGDDLVLRQAAGANRAFADQPTSNGGVPIASNP
jgi:hypothetical protein